MIQCTSLSSYRDLWDVTKKYLESYGPISRLNEDFLYAIHLSLVEEAVSNVFGIKLDTKEKLELLEEIFRDPVWQDTLKREADPIFRNLAARKEFVADIKKRILLLSDIEIYFAEKQRLFKYFEIV